MTLNIAFFSHSPHLQGAQKSLLETALLYKDDPNINIIPILPKLNDTKLGDDSKFCSLKNIKFISGPTSNPVNSWYIYENPNQPDRFNKYCKNIKDTTISYLNIFKNNKIDLLIVNTLTNFIPILAAYISKIPVITWVRGYLDPKSINIHNPEYQYIIDKSILEISDYIIYNSEPTRNIYKNLIPNYNIRDAVILNYTANPKSFINYDTLSNNFICLNRFEKDKGIITLVEAAKILKSKNYNFVVNIYGDGPEKNNLFNKIHEYNLENNFKINNSEINVDNLYDNCYALLQPSHKESFGRTLIEACSHKRPIIACSTADPVGVVKHGLNGFHVDYGDYKSFAKYMIWLIDNRDESKQMGENAYTIFRYKFDGSDVKSTLNNLIYKCINDYDRYSKIRKDIFTKLNSIHNDILSDTL